MRKLELNKILDASFKGLILMFTVVFLFLFYLSIDKNRYQFVHFTTDNPGILDSRTGELYVVAGGPSGWLKLFPISDAKPRAKTHLRESLVDEAFKEKKSGNLGGKTAQ